VTDLWRVQLRSNTEKKSLHELLKELRSVKKRIENFTCRTGISARRAYSHKDHLSQDEKSALEKLSDAERRELLSGELFWKEGNLAVEIDSCIVLEREEKQAKGQAKKHLYPLTEWLVCRNVEKFRKDYPQFNYDRLRDLLIGVARKELRKAAGRYANGYEGKAVNYLSKCINKQIKTWMCWIKAVSDCEKQGGDPFQLRFASHEDKKIYLPSDKEIKAHTIQQILRYLEPSLDKFLRKKKPPKPPFAADSHGDVDRGKRLYDVYPSPIQEASYEVIIKTDCCDGDGICVEICPSVFRIENGKAIAKIKFVSGELTDLVEEAAEYCKKNAITLDAITD
jgi:ferredoxin